MNKGLNTAVLLALIAAGLLLFGGILRDVTREVPTEEGRTVLRKLRDFISESMEQSVTVRRDIKIEGSLEHGSNFEFDDISPRELNISYIPGESNITADSNNIVVDEERSFLEITDFRGSAKLQDEEIELKGQGSSLSSGPVSMQGENLEVSVEGEYGRIYLASVELQELILEDSTGNLDIGNSLKTTLDNEHVSINAFYGDLNIEPGEINISGEASKVRPGNKTIASV